MNYGPFDNYEQAIAFLLGRVDYERAAADQLTARSFKLNRMREILRRLGDPQETIPVVHIAGTKGKGSTAAMTAQILTAAGYRTGLFTSPHISAFEERMRVDGQTPDQALCVDLFNEMADLLREMDALGPAMRATYFEIATAMAWLYFRRSRCDFAVLEVGLGGRLDSTNLCRPEVTLITNVSRDHMDVLGDSVASIAREKAGIIKPHVPLITGAIHWRPRQVIEDVAKLHDARWLAVGRDIRVEYCRDELHATPWPATVCVETPDNRYEDLPLALRGEHQAGNAALAVAAADTLRSCGYGVPTSAVYRGLATVKWPLRFEVFSGEPTFVVDAAHNVASVKAVVQTLNEQFADRPKTLVFSVCREKEVEQMAAALFPCFDHVIYTSFRSNPRALSPAELESRVRRHEHGTAETAAMPHAAIARARELAGPDGVICATGSFYLAAEARGLLTESGLVSDDLAAAVPVAAVSEAV